MIGTPTGRALPMPPGISRNLVLGYAIAALGPLAVAAICYPLARHVNETTVALAMVLVVLLIAVRWGSRPAMVASVCGVFLFDSHFVPPSGSFTLRDTEHWVALAAFLITAGTAGELSVRARSRAAEAETGRKEARRASIYNRNLIEASLDPLVTIGKDGKITDVNIATERVTGCSRRQLIGSDFSEYFIDAEKARAGYETVFREGQVRDYALEVRHRDGHTTPVLYNASLYRDENGELVGVFAAARDMSERRRAEGEIRSLARLQAAAAQLGQIALRRGSSDEVLDQAVVLIAQTLDVEYCKVLELLPGGAELLLHAGTGWTAGSVGRARVGSGRDSQAGYTLACNQPVVVEDMRSEQRFQGPPLLHEHGVVSGVSVVIATSEGPYGVLGAHTKRHRAFTTDEVHFLQSVANVLGMTIERNRAEQALRESGDSLNKAQEIAHVGSWHLDLRRNRLTWSDEVYRIFGVSKGSALDYEAFLAMLYPEDREKVARAWSAALAGAPYNVEHRILAGGEVKWVRERAKVEFGSDGRATEGNGTVQDITERVLAEAEIRALNAELEARVAARTAELEAASLEAARARERETELGFRIQKTLLLDQPPKDFPGLSVAALTIPSQRIDGDFYIFIQHQTKCLDLIIGDVMGKGAPAALLGAATKSHFLKAASRLMTSARGDRLPEPKDIVMLAHAEVARHLIDLDSFVTLCYARLDVNRGRLDLVDCGHTGIIQWHSATGLCDLVHGDNLPLGVREGEIYKQIAVPFQTGDLFLFYSDGITEARNQTGELFGADRLEQCVSMHSQLDPDDLVETVHHAVRDFSTGGRLTDDLTGVAVRVEEREIPLQRVEAEIHSDLKHLRDARQFVRSFCGMVPGPALDSDTAGKLELAVNEAASNIMKHAYRGSPDQVIQLEGEAFPSRISIRLHHFGPPFEPPPPILPDPADLAESGFGMYLMWASVDEVRYYRDGSGRNCVSLTKIRQSA